MEFQPQPRDTPQMTTEDDKPSKIQVLKNIFLNFPDEIRNFKRIPCAMSSIYTGIIGGSLTAALALISTGKLSSLRFGVFGYLGSSLASCIAFKTCKKTCPPKSLMNRSVRRIIGAFQSGGERISSEFDKKHRSFKEIIQWRKEREQKERLLRNKKLMDTLKKDINPRFQLADIRAFSLPSIRETSTAIEWKDLELRDDLIRGLTEGLKLKKPLPSQVSGILTLMKVNTGLFAAPTGSGKTLTYLLPLFQNLKTEEENAQGQKLPCNGPRALILVPTHELVRQVYATAKALSHYSKLRIETIDSVFKYKNLKTADSLDVLISTPRALLRNQSEGLFKIKMKSSNRIVVDEADTLLSADFANDVKDIISSASNCPENLRVLATSATITKQLQRTMTNIFPNLKIHMTSGLHAAVPNLRQRFIKISQPGNAKMQQVLQILQEQPTSRVMIFCNKLVKAEALHKFICDNLTTLNSNETKLTEKYVVLPSLFHGHLPPIQRESIIEKFATGSIRTLICTDLAARGLDTPWVNHVINFDFPRSLQDYLHRAGRTARAGRGGAVTSFVTAKDRALYEYIELAARQRRIFSDPL